MHITLEVPTATVNTSQVQLVGTLESDLLFMVHKDHPHSQAAHTFRTLHQLKALSGSHAILGD
jgi:hypothetical protein